MLQAATVLLVVVLSCVPAFASPFDPDRFSLAADTPLLAADGLATITLDTRMIGAWNPRTGIEAPIATGSWLASDYCPAGSFSIPVSLSLWDSDDPEAVSVTAGVIAGTFASNGFGMIHGVINTASIYSVSFAYSYVPNVPTNFVMLIDKPRSPVLGTTNEIAAVPEPTTLVLIGSGLLGLVKRRKVPQFVPMQ